MAVVPSIRIRVQTTPKVRIRVTPALIPLNATVEVGTVTTLPPGSPATVANVGTDSAAVLNFGLPQGAQGSPGIVQSVVAGTNVSVDSTDPANPKVNATGTPVEQAVHAATSKATPVDADELALVDSAASFGLKKLTWANLKAAVRAYLSSTASTWSAVQTFSAIPSLSGGAISFPSTQIPSAGANDLDDYREGTFTPTIAGTTTAGTATYTEQNGRYTKVGRLVFFEIALSWNSHTGTGNISITGLPFAAASTPTSRAVSVLYSNLTYSGDPTALISGGGTTVSPRVMTSGTSTAQIAMVASGIVVAQGYYTV